QQTVLLEIHFVELAADALCEVAASIRDFDLTGVVLPLTYATRQTRPARLRAEPARVRQGEGAPLETGCPLLTSEADQERWSDLSLRPQGALMRFHSQ